MSTSVKYYLAAYNAVAFIFWALYLVFFFGSGCQLTSTALLLLNIAQGMAALEILHAVLKWVKSPVGSTVAQVSSRLLVLVLINVFYMNPHLWPVTWIGVLVVSIAWGITELGRYSFYLLSLFEKQPAWLLWMRYTFFIVLYPLGVTGEWIIMAAPIIVFGYKLDFYCGFISVIALSYLYYFPVLYKYMWRQRKLRIM
jgi:very-long-chain (3R)-3-hydroxyacyl-CoA dehydratase